jgi:hypothetical protein
MIRGGGIEVQLAGRQIRDLSAIALRTKRGEKKKEKRKKN